MRAFVIDGPGRAGVREAPTPAAEPGQVVVDVERAGLCGTDVEFFTGEMAKLSILEFNTHHDFEHYGNMVTYMRLKGLVPPSSEGR